MWVTHCGSLTSSTAFRLCQSHQTIVTNISRKHHLYIEITEKLYIQNHQFENKASVQSWIIFWYYIFDDSERVSCHITQIQNWVIIKTDSRMIDWTLKWFSFESLRKYCLLHFRESEKNESYLSNFIFSDRFESPKLWNENSTRKILEFSRWK